MFLFKYCLVVFALNFKSLFSAVINYEEYELLRELNNDIREGDLLDISDGDELEMNSLGRNAIRSEKYKWPNGIVPYAFYSNYTVEEQQKVVEAFEIFHKNTCVKFIPKTENNVESIMFYKVPERGCFAGIGFRPDRKEPLPVNFAPICLSSQGAMQHELMHVLGLLHEQSRSDRDDYIDIHWENVHKDYIDNFRKGTPSEITAFGLPYDYKSLMHYPRNAFSKNGEYTMTAKNDTKMELGQSLGATNSDLEKIRKLYNCTIE